MPHSAILCVDDEPIILQSLKEQLKKNFDGDYRYELAENADEALEILDELVLDGIKVLIIVSDWLMPGIKGDDFLIMVHERFPEIVTVMLTGQADQDSIARAREEANLFACIMKPWTEEELVEVIRTGLSRK